MKRNKVNMQKVFATVISLSIMLALVIGIVSILRNNNSKDNKKNFIDLNEINEALNETTGINETIHNAQIDGVNKGQNAGKGVGTGENVTAKDVENIAASEHETPSDDHNILAHNDDAKGENNVALNGDKDGKVKKDINDKTPGDKDAIQSGEDMAQSGEDMTQPEENVAVGNVDEKSVEVAEVGEVEGEVAQAGNGDDASLDTPVNDDVPVNSPISLVGYSFGEQDTLIWPANGDIILNYNMTNTIYFPSLNAYRCNPAIVIAAPEGAAVYAAGDGVVTAIYETRETGLTMEVALGNDYVLTYGQLKDLCFGVGNPVKRGDIIGSVAHPSPYYSVEGPNLFFKMTHEGHVVNPTDYLD